MGVSGASVCRVYTAACLFIYTVNFREGRLHRDIGKHHWPRVKAKGGGGDAGVGGLDNDRANCLRNLP